MSPAHAHGMAAGWGSRELRRATFTLAVTQIVSWGVLYYGFAVVAPAVTEDTGWTESVVSGAFAVGLLASGVTAPVVARALAVREPRHVLAVGSLLGIVGMLAFASAAHPAMLYAAWLVVGVAMAATLYEPAMAILVALDSERSSRSVTVIAVAGGLASTVFAPVAASLTESIGWRHAIAVLALGGGGLTVILHAAVMPRSDSYPAATHVHPVPAPAFGPVLRRFQGALIFEKAAIVATTVHLIGLLVDRGVPLSTAASALGMIGVGKVLGRLCVRSALRHAALVELAAGANLVLLVALVVPLISTETAGLLAAMTIVGVASGATTIVQPLLVIDLVGPAPFAAASARLQRTSMVARSAAPFGLAGAVALVGWTAAWAAALACFALAAAQYVAIERAPGHRRRVS